MRWWNILKAKSKRQQDLTQWTQEDWYKGRCDEIFKLMKWENHKDHVGFDWLKDGIYLDDIQKYKDNCKMSLMDSMENIGGILA